MRILLSILLLISVTSCNAKPFSYDRKNACVIDYGLNGISVIVDGDRTLVKSNRQTGFGEVTAIRTANNRFQTRGRYFDERQATKIVEEMKRSQWIYVDQYVSGEHSSSRNRYSFNVSDLSQKLQGCLKKP